LNAEQGTSWDSKRKSASEGCSCPVKPSQKWGYSGRMIMNNIQQ
jgi:hypothetical protein